MITLSRLRGRVGWGLTFREPSAQAGAPRIVRQSVGRRKAGREAAAIVANGHAACCGGGAARGSEMRARSPGALSSSLSSPP
jgi:hypothetical protein